MSSDPFAARRERMVRDQLEKRGIKNPAVLAAFREVPRHEFLDRSAWARAYEDRPQVIGREATISQPFIVGYMTEKLEPAGMKVLEIGTGSGYQTAILSRLAREVCTVEVEPSLSRRAQGVLRDLNCANVSFRVADGLEGWLEKAPFDRIVLTAVSAQVPNDLLGQLSVGGWFLGPVREGKLQHLYKITRKEKGYERERLIPVVFVESHPTALEEGGL